MTKTTDSKRGAAKGKLTPTKSGAKMTAKSSVKTNAKLNAKSGFKASVHSGAKPGAHSSAKGHAPLPAKSNAPVAGKVKGEHKKSAGKSKAKEPKHEEHGFMWKLLEQKRAAQKKEENARKARGEGAWNDHAKFGPQGFGRFQGPRRRAA